MSGVSKQFRTECSKIDHTLIQGPNEIAKNEHRATLIETNLILRVISKYT